jgi:hypothetical protein
LDGCFNECSRVDYGSVRATFFNERKEKLPNIEIAIYPIRFRTFENSHHPDLTSLAMVRDYYGAQIFKTDGTGNLDITVSDEDGTSSCDGPRKTFDNAFNSIVLFYMCGSAGLKHQEFISGDGLLLVGSVNEIDSVFIKSDCLQ